MDTTTTTSKQSTVLAGAGALFLILAGFFLWRDLSLPRELEVTVAALFAGTATALQWPKRWPILAPVALILTVAVAGCWFTAQKQAALLPPLGIAVVTAAAAVLRSEHTGERKLADRLIWYAFGAALLAGSWALYFHFFTAGFAADWVARRLIPTVAWLAMGLAFFIGGHRHAGRVPAAVHVGIGFIAVAMGKAALYDTSHLHGYLRIGVLAAVGALLVFGARVLTGARKELV